MTSIDFSSPKSVTLTVVLLDVTLFEDTAKLVILAPRERSAAPESQVLPF